MGNSNEKALKHGSEMNKTEFDRSVFRKRRAIKYNIFARPADIKGAIRHQVS